MKWLLLLLSTTSFAQVIPKNTVSIGKTGAANKSIEFNLTKAGASTNPQIRWNNSTSKLQSSNDGTNFVDLGSAMMGSINCSHTSAKCRVEYAYFAHGSLCTTGTCTKNYGSDALTLTWLSAGNYQVNATAGTFTSNMYCLGNHSINHIETNTTAPTSTTYKIQTYNNAATAANSSGISVICFGTY